jgi:hypothetical protein
VLSDPAFTGHGVPVRYPITNNDVPGFQRALNLFVHIHPVDSKQRFLHQKKSPPLFSICWRMAAICTTAGSVTRNAGPLMAG